MYLLHHCIFQEPVHIYRPDRLPPCRQMFYQICDIQVDEVQDLVKKGKVSITFIRIYDRVSVCNHFPSRGII